VKKIASRPSALERGTKGAIRRQKVPETGVAAGKNTETVKNTQRSGVCPNANRCFVWGKLHPRFCAVFPTSAPVQALETQPNRKPKLVKK
jgi:hypothetical protein